MLTEQALTARADELMGKDVLTSEERNELKGIPARIADFRETAALKATFTEQRKSWDAQVPAANRPEFAMEVKHGRTESFRTNDQDAFRVNIRRKDYSIKDISEDDYVQLKQDRYSDNTIQAACTNEYAKEFAVYMKSGGKQYPETVLKAMTEAGSGSVLVPLQWGDLITNPPMNTMLRGQVKNMPSTVQTMKFPRVNTSDSKYPAYPVTVQWGGEQPSSLTEQGANVSTTNIDITVGEVYAYGDFSISLLEDNIYGLSNYIPEMFAESLDVDLDYRILKGTGTTVANQNQPWGFNETSVLPTVTAASSTAVAYNDLVNLFVKVPQQYRAQGVWVFNSNTFGLISKLVDGSSRPLFLPNYGYLGDTPGGGAIWSSGTILGRPFVISENMDDAATGGKISVWFGNLNKAYIMLNRVGPTIRVLDQTKFTAGNYQYVLRARMGGRIVQPYAVAGLKHT